MLNRSIMNMFHVYVHKGRNKLLAGDSHVLDTSTDLNKQILARTNNYTTRMYVLGFRDNTTFDLAHRPVFVCFYQALHRFPRWDRWVYR